MPGDCHSAVDLVVWRIDAALREQLANLAPGDRVIVIQEIMRRLEKRNLKPNPNSF